MSDTPYGPYGDPVRLDGKLFYAAKHVEDGDQPLHGGLGPPVGVPLLHPGGIRLGRQPGGPEDLVQKEDGTLCLAPVDAVADSFSVRRALAVEQPHVGIEAGTLYTYADAFTCYESFRLTGEFTFYRRRVPSA